MAAKTQRRVMKAWRQALAVVCAPIAMAALIAAATGEYEVKAAYLLNFTKFVEWPASSFASADSPIAICVIGSNPFGRVLEELVQGEEVNGRKITTRFLSQPSSARTCQVVFIPAETKDTAGILKGLGPG